MNKKFPQSFSRLRACQEAARQRLIDSRNAKAWASSRALEAARQRLVDSRRRREEGYPRAWYVIHITVFVFTMTEIALLLFAKPSGWWTDNDFCLGAFFCLFAILIGFFFLYKYGTATSRFTLFPLIVFMSWLLVHAIGRLLFW